jgi:murein DD-endopeptidase MepM/ murein hydrolase activator NlpD
MTAWNPNKGTQNMLFLRTTRCVAFFLALGFASAQPKVQTQTSASPNLNQLQGRLKETQVAQAAQAKKVEVLRSSLSQLSQQEQQKQLELQASGRQIALLQNNILDLQGKQAQTQNQITDVQSQLELSQARADRLRASVSKLLLRMYRSKSGEYVRLIARAETMHDVLLRSNYANRLNKQDLELITSLKDAIAQLERYKNELATLKSNQEAQEKSLKEQQEQLKGQQDIQQQAVRVLRRSQVGQNAILLDTLDSKKQTEATMGQLVQQIVSEKARLERERLEQLRRLEEERKRREAEAKRIAAEQARLKQLAAEAEAKRVAAEQEAQKQAVIAEEKRQAALVEQRKQEAEQRRLEANAANKKAAARAETLRRERALQDITDREEAAKRDVDLAAARKKEKEARDEAAQLEKERKALERRNAVSVDEGKRAITKVSALNAAIVPKNYSGNLGFPMPGGRVSQGFDGFYVLLSGQEGAAITATGAGTVLKAAYYAAQGTMIMIQHSDSLVSGYLCLQSPTVSSGQHVSSGQIIGYAGGCPAFGTDTIGYQVIVGTSPVNPL